MVLDFSKDFEMIFQDIEKNATITTVTITTDNDWGSPSETDSSEIKIKCIFKEVSNKEIREQEGVLDVGDAIIYLKNIDADNVSLNDKITIDNSDYNVIEKNKSPILSNVYTKLYLKLIQK